MCRLQQLPVTSIDREFILSRRDVGEHLVLEHWASCRDVFSLTTLHLLTSAPSRPKPTKRSYRGGRLAGIRYEARVSAFTTNPRWFTRPVSSKEKLIHRSSLPGVSFFPGLACSMPVQWVRGMLSSQTRFSLLD